MTTVPILNSTSSVDELWDSVPWQEYHPSSSSSAAASSTSSAAAPSPSSHHIWHKHQIPYLSGANALQHLDIWIPVAQNCSPPENLCSLQGTWAIYIHGGAWRDPAVTSSSFIPTLEHLFKSHESILSKVAGFASISYTLSPYPNHPTDPSPPKDPSVPVDNSRMGRHPDHILDVLRALRFLQVKAGFGDDYVLLGHSCGATLAFQVLEDQARWGIEASRLGVIKPKKIIGLSGLYDLPALIRDPGEKHAAWKWIYEELTRGAFGGDEKTWYDASPASVKGRVEEWGRNDGQVFLVQSKEDSLVPYRQMEDFLRSWQSSRASGVQVTELPASGDHDELWEKGDRIAEIVVEVLLQER
ncbi:hypothetical protein PV10_03060 [Exophiala mesophila]|uniref:Kynurenine formamidase n=1 Tax=Exophiala mesophila TaxID=212818 RepID=A0A0D1Y3Z0_EXOME|nr:uncharacterized protein PV10_03060 [Exophiala mesophila]KIV95396.1 hypothetical protein PV10_03060 [Exophiala mesophila]